MKYVKEAIVKWIKEWFDKNGPGCMAVIGISGGKDSSVVAALCVKALGKDRVIGVLMPNGEQSDISYAYGICEYLDIKHYVINIKDAFESALKVKNIDLKICSLALRRVLECICKERDAKGKKLEQMIEDMIDRGILPKMFNDACWIIRQLGNSAAHDEKSKFTIREVDSTVSFMQDIINYLYILLEI